MSYVQKEEAAGIPDSRAMNSDRKPSAADLLAFTWQRRGRSRKGRRKRGRRKRKMRRKRRKGRGNGGAGGRAA